MKAYELIRNSDGATIRWFPTWEDAWWYVQRGYREPEYSLREAV